MALNPQTFLFTSVEGTIRPLSICLQTPARPVDWSPDLMDPTKKQRLYHPTCNAYVERFGIKVNLPLAAGEYTAAHIILRPA
jgi:hypothetical protein